MFEPSVIREHEPLPGCRCSRQRNQIPHVRKLVNLIHALVGGQKLVEKRPVAGDLLLLVDKRRPRTAGRQPQQILRALQLHRKRRQERRRNAAGLRAEQLRKMHGVAVVER